MSADNAHAFQINKYLGTSLDFEIVRCFFVSAAAFLLDLLVFSLSLHLLHFSWVGAAIMGFCFGALFNYLASIHWAFRERRLEGSAETEFALFALVGLVGLMVVQLVLWVGVELFSVTPEIVKVIAAVMAFISNFILRKIILF